MKTIWKWFLSVVATVAAAFFFLSRAQKSKKRLPVGPPKNKVTEVMAEDINNDLTEGLDAIVKATESDDPSKELAALGNKRSRR